MSLYSKNDKKDFLVNKKVGSVHVYEVKLKVQYDFIYEE